MIYDEREDLSHQRKINAARTVQRADDRSTAILSEDALRAVRRESHKAEARIDELQRKTGLGVGGSGSN